MDRRALEQWLEAVDSITYYELFGIEPSASHDEVRAAFHAFAESFHPDVHLWRRPWEQSAIGHIYRRGTEAFRVLSDPDLRARYDEAVTTGNLHPEELLAEPAGPTSLP